MIGNGVGVPTIPTLPVPLPTVPIPVPVPTLPPVLTVPTLPVPTLPPVPTVPTVPGPGPSGPPPGPGPSGPPPAAPGPSTGSSSPSPGSSNPASTSSTSPPEACSSPSSTSTTSAAPPDESSIPPSESSAPSSEPPEPTQVTTATTECDPATSGSTSGSTSPLPDQIAEADLTIAAVLASVEVLAVSAYTTARDAGAAGSFGDVPPAVAQYVDTTLGHHQAALVEWNGVLVAAGRPAVLSAPVNLAISISEQFDFVTDAAGTARLALSLERLAAATYLDAVGKLSSEPAVRLAGSILSIDQQHMSVLLFALGEYPVPETFATAELAFVP